MLKETDRERLIRTGVITPFESIEPARAGGTTGGQRLPRKETGRERWERQLAQLQPPSEELNQGREEGEESGDDSSSSVRKSGQQGKAGPKRSHLIMEEEEEVEVESSEEEPDKSRRKSRGKKATPKRRKTAEKVVVEGDAGPKSDSDYVERDEEPPPSVDNGQTPTFLDDEEIDLDVEEGQETLASGHRIISARSYSSAAASRFAGQTDLDESYYQVRLLAIFVFYYSHHLPFPPLSPARRGSLFGQKEGCNFWPR